MFKVIVGLATVGATVFALIGVPVFAQEFKDHGKGTVIIKHSKMKLGIREEQSFSWLAKNPRFFGAMAAHESEDVGASFRTFNSLEAARYFALVNCQEIAREQGLTPSGCVLYASAIPKSLSKNTNKAKGLPERAQPFLDVYRAQQEPGLFGAFAASDPGSGGWSFGQVSEAKARSRAISECENYSKTIEKQFNMPPRAFRQLKREGWFKCYIIDIARP